MKLDVRYGANPNDFRHYDTDRLRNDFLISRLFIPGDIRMIYSHIDRIITGGACPTVPLSLECDREIGTEFFLQRREMGIINVGAPGTVIADGERFYLRRLDGLYLGAGIRSIIFESGSHDDHAHFYFSSVPAHTSYPNCVIDFEKAKKVRTGEPEKANVRTVNQYIHPEVCGTCQLMMGLTQLETGNVWNTMPCHTHDRRMEVYFYFDIPQGGVTFHIFGQPEETRHIVVRNEEAVINPSWSVHSAAGTSSYSFIWSMAGENQKFTDMDHVPMSAMK
ncbi:5-dehydro-4-deoxy-D-glucuronate isomerase [Aminivibrio sp.]|uniref:5-dehydro-4-deoxy-D-glucuronate isomerase n=1 Tax=Aminivibrio sp. TaxID=1872489 RepID=UPI001A5185DA|nr:5-dehydro-4-deoxy-D-glucuronate isomerase [Aminivibrio sp.]MBL3538217.1 5-dehydro-4-deoxy-D-glucuronate isomerase [Aminivibrio sp.]